ncbi:nSTAND1 domain-containing NTPase [Leptolyngbya sp. NIES-2104]|uniref:nSTAND1 domain-containing NTPase n=1 Tax=Leptolyngbya sp. NIES-2104 TaxID=1552121 RepID=UPI0006ECA59A|nr:caspase family protein [Leptolyngbya sp. NIES-2104]GAP96275.1 high-affnity carbon uptake protein Hat/HatR [Leptolyngbya sp. NIES-2104]
MAWDTRTNFTRNLAVVIGVDDYASKSIHKLSTPVSDASAIADLLETDYAYQQINPKTEVIRLLNQQATLVEIRDVLTKTLPQLQPNEGDRLIFYFAGHGLPRTNEDGPEGYLVPQDADPANPDSFLPMQEVAEELSKLACHHLLVILDCCFAGTFRWVGRRDLIPVLKTIHREHYYRFIRYPAWQLITSAAHDQEALDVAKLNQDKRGEVLGYNDRLHSPFALALLEGLQYNKDSQRQNADLIPDGVVTAHELFVYLERRVSELSKEQQTPGLFPLRRDYDKGEFIFTAPRFDPEKQLEPAPELNEENNPYRGLKSFDEKHAAFFFGRQVLIEALVKKLCQPNQTLHVVLGVSGSGKSSLVKAGLLPRLRTDEGQWFILEPMRPQLSPFTALARILLPIVNPALIEQLPQVCFLDEKLKQSTAPIAGWDSARPETKLLLIEDYFVQLQELCSVEEQRSLTNLHQSLLTEIEAIAQQLQQDPHYLGNEIQKWSQTHPNATLLLVIDQFEELITMSQSSWIERDRASDSKQLPFLELLRDAIAVCPQQWRVVVTLRSDFEPRFLDSPLQTYWQAARFPVRAMNSDELRQAIEGPALKQALYFEPDNLVGMLIDEVGQMPGALPLLSFTLSELYVKLRERWTKDESTDRALRLQDYEELGGVAGALTRRATEEYESLGNLERATMRRVMLRMVTLKGSSIARRQVPEVELVYPSETENRRRENVIDQLVNARLLVKGQEMGRNYVEPAHDLLLRWNRLQEWIEQEQETLALQQRLTPAANDWYNDGPLLPDGDRLDRLEKLLKQKDTWLNRLEIRFIQASLDFREHQKRRERELTVRTELGQKAARVMTQLSISPLEAMTLAIQATGQNLEELPHEMLTSVQRSLYTVMNKARIPNITFQGQHTQKITSIAFHPTNRYVVSGSTDKTLRLWNWEQGLVTPAFVGHEGEVNAVAFGHNGQYIISASDDGTIRLWNFQLQPIGEPFVGHQGAVTSVAVSPEGQYIVSGGADGMICFWNLRGELIRKPLNGHQGAINSVAVSPDGQYIVSGGIDNTIRLWNSKGRWIGDPFVGHQDNTSIRKGVYCAIFSSDSQSIASCGADSTIRLWNLKGEALISQPLKQGGVAAILFSPDGQKIVGVGHGICSWTVEGLQVEEYFSQNSYYINCVAFSNDGQHFVTGESGSAIKIWDLERDEIEAFAAHETEIATVTFSPEGQQLASGSFDETIRVWNLANANEKILEVEKSRISSVALSPDGTMIAGGCDDCEVRLWNLKGEVIRSFGERKDTRSVAFSPNSNLVASMNTDAVHLWDVNGNLKNSLPLQSSASSNLLAFSPDGSVLACGSGFAVRVWDWSKNIVQALPGEADNVIQSVRFSQDGKTIITSDVGGSVFLWNWKEGDRKRFRHSNSVYSACFSPDGKTIVSGGGKAFLWDSDGNLIATFQGRDHAINSVAFSSDGRIIAAGSSEGTLHLWRGNWKEWLQVCCNRIRNHNSFKNPQTDLAKEVCEICRKYVWNENDV